MIVSDDLVKASEIHVIVCTLSMIPHTYVVQMRSHSPTIHSCRLFDSKATVYKISLYQFFENE